jgi:hypothetical protein
MAVRVDTVQMGNSQSSYVELIKESVTCIKFDCTNSNYFQLLVIL